MVLKNYGEGMEYSCAERALYGAMHTISKTIRTTRICRVAKDGTARQRIPSKKVQQPYLCVPGNRKAGPGVWIVYYDEVRNQKDDFVKNFIRNPLISEDPTFLESIKQVKVSFTFIFYIFISKVSFPCCFQ